MSQWTDRAYSWRHRLVAALACTLLANLATAAATEQGVQAQTASPVGATAMVIELDGVIGVASAAFVARGIEQARKRNAELVIVRMDTPGGLVSSTREIIGSILGSTVPVAVYV